MLAIYLLAIDKITIFLLYLITKHNLDIDIPYRNGMFDSDLSLLTPLTAHYHARGTRWSQGYAPVTLTSTHLSLAGTSCPQTLGGRTVRRRQTDAVATPGTSKSISHADSLNVNGDGDTWSLRFPWTTGVHCPREIVYFHSSLQHKFTR